MSAGEPTSKMLLDTMKYHFDKGNVEASKCAFTELLKSKRSMPKYLAAKFILTHEKDLCKIENPANHKIEHSGFIDSHDEAASKAYRMRLAKIAAVKAAAEQEMAHSPK